MMVGDRTTTAASDWGVPDWRDGGSYPASNKLSAKEWWWEFTRRRPDYRALWERWSPINREEVLRNAADYRRLAIDCFGDESLDVFLDRAPTDDPDALRLNFEMSTLLNPAKSFGEWELGQHLHPANVATYRQSHNAMTYAVGLRKMLGEESVEAAIAERKRKEEMQRAVGLTHYVFDLSKPLARQFVKAKRHLTALQKERWGKQKIERPQPHLWPLYLRALDAKASGATYAEMEGIFWPRAQRRRRDGKEEKTPQSARDVFNAAVKLRNMFPR